MGTYCSSQTMAEMIRELLAPGTDPGDPRTIEHKRVGECLWRVVEFQSEGRTRRIIALDLLSRSRGMACYKPMDESMGPFYYTCPLHFLDLAKDEDWGPMAKTWRAKVREAHGVVEEQARLMDVERSQAAPDYGGAFDGVTVTSDADPGL